MTLDNLNGKVTVAPTTGSQNGVYRLEATWTSVDLNISDPKYIALEVTVTCTITSFTRPTPSSSPIAITQSKHLKQKRISNKLKILIYDIFLGQ